MASPLPRHPRALLAAALLFGGCSGGAETETTEVRSVVLIVVDTLRADHLGAFGYERATSPHLDRWSTAGRVFERALATSPWTLPSFASMFTGEIPSRHGAGRVQIGPKRHFTALDPGLATLAERLSERGFATGAIATNPFLAPELGLARGFEHYDYEPGGNRDSPRASEIVDKGLAWIDGREDPWFLMLHFFDPHLDYDAPEPVRGRFTESFDSTFARGGPDWDALRKGHADLDEADRAYVAAAYDEELLYLDGELERLFTELERRGILSEGLVLLTSDHGEELFEHDGFEHGHAMWQELLHVPFVVWGAGVVPGRDPAAVSLVDVAPTVLHALGVPFTDELAGVSLWPAIQGRASLPERTLVAESLLYGAERKVALRWPFKLVDDGEQAVLYDLERDPGEAHDRAGEEVEMTERLSRRLRRQTRRARSERRTEQAELPEETQERLRALGYVE